MRMHMSSSTRRKQSSVAGGRWSVSGSNLSPVPPLGLNMAVQSYRQLIAWQKAMELVKLVYDLTDRFPREELFGLTQQIRKAVVAIPSNIAEGQGRNSTKEFLYIFRLHMAL